MFEKQSWMQRAGEYPQSDQEYFALLARAVFSAGLGPKVVESRWSGMTQAFRGWDPVAVAQMDEGDVARLLSDPGVIRNRRKIEAVIRNAGTFNGLLAGQASLHAYLESLGAGADMDAASEALSRQFAHLGRTSALFFLFSAGWRPRETEEAPAELKAAAAAGPAGEAPAVSAEGPPSARRRRASKEAAGLAVAANG